MSESSPNSPFVTLFVFFFQIIAVLIILYVGSKLLTFLPRTATVTNTTYAPATSTFNIVQALYDNSFIFFIMFVMVLDIYVAWRAPNVGMGIVNILLFFFLAYFSLQVASILPAINTALTANVLLPNTYAFFSNNYFILLTSVFLALSIIFNFRKPPQKTGYYGH